MKLFRKWFTRNFTHHLWFKTSNRPEKPCKIIIYNEEKGTGTSYNYNGKDWNLGPEFVWTHAPNFIIDLKSDQQNVLKI